MVPGPEGHQVRVVGGGGDGHRPGAPDVGVTQLVSQLLQLIRLKPEQQCLRNKTMYFKLRRYEKVCTAQILL